jgi:hypothetical protein
MWCMLFVSFFSCSVPSWWFVSVLFSLLGFTMYVSSEDDGSILECAAWGPSLAAEFRTGWEGWLEGACLAQVASDRDEAVCCLARGAKKFLGCS